MTSGQLAVGWVKDASPVGCNKAKPHCTGGSLHTALRGFNGQGPVAEGTGGGRRVRLAETGLVPGHDFLL